MVANGTVHSSFNLDQLLGTSMSKHYFYLNIKEKSQEKLTIQEDFTT